jgi:hypothetical protein
MIVTLGSMDMRIRWNSQSLLVNLMVFLRALRERILKGNDRNRFQDLQQQIQIIFPLGPEPSMPRARGIP